MEASSSYGTTHDAEELNAEGILDMARAPRCDGDEALRGALTGASRAGARDVHGQLDGARVRRVARAGGALRQAGK